MKAETIEYKGKEIEIYYDEDPLNPRTEFDNLGTMICFHNRYKLGDEHKYDIDETKVMFEDKKNIALPLYLYDHSEITMNTTGFSCPWDSGQVGIIFVTKETIRKEYGWTKITKQRHEKILSYLIGEVAIYDDYLTGNVYGYETDDDSCSGFFGNDHEKSGLLEYAEDAIDCQIEQEKKEARESLKEEKLEELNTFNLSIYERS